MEGLLPVLQKQYVTVIYKEPTAREISYNYGLPRGLVLKVHSCLLFT